MWDGIMWDGTGWGNEDGMVKGVSGVGMGWDGGGGGK